MSERAVDEQGRRGFEHAVVIEERFVCAPKHSDVHQAVTFGEGHGVLLCALGADPEDGKSQSFLSSKLLDLAGFRVTHWSTGSPEPNEHGSPRRAQPSEIDGPAIAKVDEIKRGDRRLRSGGV